jgi:hypothetical protein
MKYETIFMRTKSREVLFWGLTVFPGRTEMMNENTSSVSTFTSLVIELEVS